MSTGRTSWYAEDAAWLRREAIVELGEEFGPAGPLVVKALRGWTQEQVRGTAEPIRNGFRLLAREAFVSVEEARNIVEYAAGIGALDDLAIDEDGRRFTCRVSGWAADQEQAAATFRKRAERAREAEKAEVRGAQDQDVSQKPHGKRDTSPLPDLTRPDQKEEQRERARPKSVGFRGEGVPSEVVADAVALLDVFNEATGRSLGAWASGGKPSSALKQVFGALLARPDVGRDRWEAGIRRIVEKPPAWLEGQIQVGHVFGERAAEWTLTAGDDGPSSGRTAPSSRWAAWVDEHLPDFSGFRRDAAVTRAGGLASAGHEPDPDEIRRYIDDRWPAEEPAPA